MGKFSVVGKTNIRIDGAAKVSGVAEYVADIKMRGLLCGKILRSPYPHARILNIDTSKAERLKGVRAVATIEDTPKKNYGAYRSGVEDELIFAQDKVRFAGDEVAAVAAVDEEVAREALDLIKVDYELLPAVFDPEEALKPDAPRIHDVEQNIASSSVVTRGDVEAGFREADLVLEDRFETGIQIHGYLEPVSCIASFDSSGRLTLWAPLQNPSWSRFVFAQALDMPPENIRVVQTLIGGAYGGKYEHKQYLIGAVLARKSGFPVRMVNTRQEEFCASMPRVPMIIWMKLGMKKNGILTTKHAKIIADNGAYTKFAAGVLNLGTYRVDGLYRLKNIKNENLLVYTNKIPTSAFRGFGNPQATFAIESLLDSMAAKLGLDPLDVRLKNAAQKGDVTAHGFKFVSCGFKECLEKVASRIGWKERKNAGRGLRGLGISGTTHVCGNRAFFPLFDGSSAWVRVGEQGDVKVFTGEVEVGQGMLTAFAIIAAEELGIGLQRLSVEPVDTDISPFGLGTWGDRATVIGGNAVKLAAADARRQLHETAAEMLEVSVDDIDARDGKIYVKGSPDKFLSFKEVASACVFRHGGAPVLGKGTYIPDSEVFDETRYGNVSPTYAFGAQSAEVEVDPETGEVKILRLVAAQDAGTVLYPVGAEGQIEGAVLQGMGYALMEEVKWDSGLILNPNFSGYGTPTVMEVPLEVETVLVESIDPAGPYGAKGIAEPAMAPTAPAIANAIYDAAGIRIKSLPITREKILEALMQKKAKPSS